MHHMHYYNCEYGVTQTYGGRLTQIGKCSCPLSQGVFY